MDQVQPVSTLPDALDVLLFAFLTHSFVVPSKGKRREVARPQSLKSGPSKERFFALSRVADVNVRCGG